MSYLSQYLPFYLSGPPIAVSTKPAKGVSAFKATLHGSVDPDNAATSYWFEYWKEGEEGKPAFAPLAKGGDAGEGSEVVAVSERIEGLQKNTTYYFRLAASNENGEAQGEVLSFFTLRSAVAVVREYPPDQLAWRIDPPGGAPNRLGAEEPLAENVLDDCQLVSEMQGGYKEAKTTLARDPRLPWPDLMPYGEVTVYGPGVDKRWEGRGEKPPGGIGGQSSVEFTAVGHAAALEDNKGLLGLGYIHSDLRDWGDPSTDRKADLIGYGYSTAAATSVGWQGNEPEASPPMLMLDFSNVETVAGKSMLGYAEFDGGAPIGRLLYQLKVLAGPEGSPAWADAVAAAADSRFKEALALGADLNATSGTGEMAANAGARFASVASYYSDAGGTHMSDIHGWLLKVLGNHKLALQGTWPDIGFTAKQMLGHAIPLYSYLEARDEDLQDDGFLIPHAWFTSAGELASVVKELTKYGLLDWFVYGEKRFQLRFPGTYGRRWLVPASQSEFQEDGLDGSRLWKDIVVQFQDYSGRTVTVGPPGSGATVESTALEITDPDHPAVRAVNIYGDKFVRRDLLVATGVLDIASATKLGENWLAEANELNRSGSLDLVGYIMDDRTMMRPASEVKAGDLVKPLGSGDASYRKITHCDYQHSERKAACSLDAPPEGIAALQERFQIELQARGLAS
jgi:hypothetical protein